MKKVNVNPIYAPEELTYDQDPILFIQEEESKAKTDAAKKTHNADTSTTDPNDLEELLKEISNKIYDNVFNEREVQNLKEYTPILGDSS